LTYDALRYPSNPGIPPLDGTEASKDAVSPKLGLEITPWKGGRLRTAWTRSLGGASFDQSLRLEPAQVAGFLQSYRTLIPEAVLGTFPAQEIDLRSVGFEQLLPTRTWILAEYSEAQSEAERDLGALRATRQFPDQTLHENAAFRERRLAVAARQLLGQCWSAGIQYTWTESDLSSRYADFDSDYFEESRQWGLRLADGHGRSHLDRVVFTGAFNHPAGGFARWDSTWTRQENELDAAGYSGDAFWQHDLWLGWRFARRQAELAVGLLNVTDQDYRLYPLNWYVDTYRARTVVLRWRCSF
jgi:hypothetical protein